MIKAFLVVEKMLSGDPGVEALRKESYIFSRLESAIKKVDTAGCPSKNAKNELPVDLFMKDPVSSFSP